MQKFLKVGYVQPVLLVWADVAVVVRKGCVPSLKA